MFYSISCFLMTFLTADVRRGLIRLELFMPDTPSRLSAAEVCAVDFK